MPRCWWTAICCLTSGPHCKRYLADWSLTTWPAFAQTLVRTPLLYAPCVHCSPIGIPGSSFLAPIAWPTSPAMPDAGELLNMLADWFDADQATLQRILVDNPARLFDFPAAR